MSHEARMQLGFAAWVLCAAVACGEREPERPPAGTGGAGGQGVATFEQSACGTCVRQACAGETDGCLAEPGCATYMDCLNRCPVDASGNADPACENNCPALTSTAAKQAKQALDECRFVGPGSACAACGVEVPPIHPILSQTCEVSADALPCHWCHDEYCCKSQDACEMTPGCPELQTCIAECTDSACTLACLNQYPGAPANAYAENTACLAYSCVEECSVGACMGCKFAQCPNATLLCFTDPDCLRALQCIEICDADPDCEHPCIDAIPDEAFQKVVSMLDCSANQCSGICPL